MPIKLIGRNAKKIPSTLMDNLPESGYYLICNYGNVVIFPEEDVQKIIWPSANVGKGIITAEFDGRSEEYIFTDCIHILPHIKQ